MSRFALWIPAVLMVAAAQAAAGGLGAGGPGLPGYGHSSTGGGRAPRRPSELLHRPLGKRRFIALTIRAPSKTMLRTPPQKLRFANIFFESVQCVTASG